MRQKKESCILPDVRRVLVAWIGNTDLRAPAEPYQVGLGPVCQALETRQFDEAFLLSNYKNDVVPYLNWLRSRTKTRIELVKEELTGPTQFGEIYEAAIRGVLKAQGKTPGETALTFHLSPGTPAMAGRAGWRFETSRCSSRGSLVRARKWSPAPSIERV